MSAQTWAAEPWQLDCKPNWAQLRSTDYERAAQCVNALAGVADPAAELARLRACEAALRRIVAWQQSNADAGELVDLVEGAQAALFAVGVAWVARRCAV